MRPSPAKPEFWNMTRPSVMSIGAEAPPGPRTAPLEGSTMFGVGAGFLVGCHVPARAEAGASAATAKATAEAIPSGRARGMGPAPYPRVRAAQASTQRA